MREKRLLLRSKVQAIILDDLVWGPRFETF